MLVSIFLAKLMGVYFVLVSLSLIVNVDKIKKLSNVLIKNSGLTWMFGFFTLILGLIAVQLHNVWTDDWRVVITVLAWLTLLKGAFLVLSPDSMETILKALNVKFYRVATLLILILGLYLSYFGFIA